MLGLALGRHVDGLVDAYYGPPELARAVAALPLASPAALAAEGKALAGDLDAASDRPLGAGLTLAGHPAAEALAALGTRLAPGHEQEPLSPLRRRYLQAQVLGAWVTARKLAGEAIGYSDEVEACYGIRPHRVDEEDFVTAHAELDAVVPGTGPLVERYVAWKEAQVVPEDRLLAAVSSLSEDLRERTVGHFGLPEGEKVGFAVVRDKPWSGFNYYLGGLESKVAINVDLPVLSTGLAHLVAHEAYPGHHTEHSLKEAGLVRRGGVLEETMFLVGTPQCLMAEGLADLGIEVVMGERPEPVVAEHLVPLGIPYDAEVVGRVFHAMDVLSGVRANAALMLHEGAASAEEAASYMARFALLPPERAAKAVEFLADPLWRSYISCYVEGLPACRRFVQGRPERFKRLLTEQLTPADLLAG